MSSRQGELAALLAAHSPADDEEARDLETMRVYGLTLGDRFSRDEPVAHFTGSAVVVDGEGAPAVNCNRLRARTRVRARVVHRVAG